MFLWNLYFRVALSVEIVKLVLLAVMRQAAIWHSLDRWTKYDVMEMLVWSVIPVQSVKPSRLMDWMRQYARYLTLQIPSVVLFAKIRSRVTLRWEIIYVVCMRVKINCPVCVIEGGGGRIITFVSKLHLFDKLITKMNFRIMNYEIKFMDYYFLVSFGCPATCCSLFHSLDPLTENDLKSWESGMLNKKQNKGFIKPSKKEWGKYVTFFVIYSLVFLKYLFKADTLVHIITIWDT